MERRAMHIAEWVRRQRTKRFSAHDTFPRRRALFLYSPGEPHNAGSHECMTRVGIAKKLASLLGCDFLGDYDAAAAASHDDRTLFFVPSHTIVGVDNARALGIRSERDLFGGVVPHEFVATKSITHAVVDEAATTP